MDKRWLLTLLMGMAMAHGCGDDDEEPDEGTCPTLETEGDPIEDPGAWSEATGEAMCTGVEACIACGAWEPDFVPTASVCTGEPYYYDENLPEDCAFNAQAAGDCVAGLVSNPCSSVGGPVPLAVLDICSRVCDPTYP